MSKYIINGGVKLKGKIKLSGNKNSILPCMAACLLTEEEVILKNVPWIADVEIFLQIFDYLGVNVEKNDHQLKLKSRKISNRVF